MPIELIVEDGSIVANANTYNDLPAIKAHALLRNITLPDDDEIVKANAILAMDYLEVQSYNGERTLGLLQELEFPRTGLIVGPDLYDDDYMPPNLLKAHCQLVADISSGIVLFPSVVTLNRVKRKKVGPLDTEWFDTPGITPILTRVDALLAPLLNGDAGFGLRTVRV